MTGFAKAVIFVWLLFSRPAIGEALTLQYFPELPSDGFRIIKVLDENFALAIRHQELWHWDGRQWQLFPNQPPQMGSSGQNIAIYSPDSFLLTFAPDEHYYHVNVLHYYCGSWRRYPQHIPYQISNMLFTAENRFYGSGHRSTLFYFDGNKFQNIQLPMPSETNQLLRVFGDGHFYILLSPQQFTIANGEISGANNKSYIWEYKNGDWRLLHTIVGGGVGKFSYISADSIIYVRRLFNPTREINYQILLMSNGELTTLDIPLNIDQQPVEHKTPNFHKMYYFFSENGRVFRINMLTGIIKELADLENVDVRNIYPIDSNSMFIVDDGTMYYLGKDLHGKSVEIKKSSLKHFAIGNSAITYGKSLYRNRSGKLELYLTDAEGDNAFYEFLPGGYVNNLFRERGLLGYGEKIEDGFWYYDACVYFGDLDNDGDADGLLAAFAGKSLIYENTGADWFEDISKSNHFNLIGRINLLALADLNGDGFLDIAVGDDYGAFRLLINSGFMTFTEMPFLSLENLVSFQPCLADWDNDGDSDILLYSVYGAPKLYENLTQKGSRQPVFADVSDRAPALTTPFDFYTQSVTPGDFDNDGDLDLFMANRTVPSRLFRNDGDFHFSDVTVQTIGEKSTIAYGGSWGDFDEDGDPDLVLATLGKNYLYWNDNTHFRCDSLVFAVNKTAYTTGALVEDLNDNGNLDIFFSNSYIGGDVLYENAINNSNPTIIEIEGSESNRDAIGSSIWLYEAGFMNDARHLLAYQQLYTHWGYMVSSLPQARFYLPDREAFDIKVLLPSGKEIQKYALQTGLHHYLKEDPSANTTLNKAGYLFQSFFLNPNLWRVTSKLMFLGIGLSVLMFLLWQYALWFPQNLAFLGGIMGFSASIIWLSGLHEYALVWYWGLVIIAIVSVPVIHSYLENRRRDVDPLPVYDLLRQFHHGRTGSRQLDRLLFLCNNLPARQTSEMQHQLRSESALFLENAYHQLSEIIRQSRFWFLKGAEFYRIQDVLRQVTHFCRQAGYDKQPDYYAAAQRIQSLKKQIWQLLSQVERHIRSNMLECLNQVTKRYSEFGQITVQRKDISEKMMVVMPGYILEKIIENLLQNASEATAGQAERNLRISINKDLIEENVLLTFCDNGPGIPEQMIGQIYEEGYSGKQSSGLGLYHARKYLQYYGGDIEYLPSEPQTGACFRLKLRIQYETLSHSND